jgi:hypothetical protein
MSTNYKNKFSGFTFNVNTAHVWSVDMKNISALALFRKSRDYLAAATATAAPAAIKPRRTKADVKKSATGDSGAGTVYEPVPN